jgi:uncharacterized protein with NAD-binding domain and iron-sulfur cluster
MPANYPTFINGSVDMPLTHGPYMQKDATLAAFLLKSDQQQLQKLCDTYLNIPGQNQFHYQAILPFSMLVYARMQISSLDSQDKNIGTANEGDVGFWVPVAATKLASDGKTYVIDHLAWFLPYLFVDDEGAVITGREVYGFRKNPAIFHNPQTITDPTFSVDVAGFKTFKVDGVKTLQPLLEVCAVATNPESPSQPTQSWKNSTEALQGILNLINQSATDTDRLTVDKWTIMSDFLDSYKKGVQMVFLKQTPFVGNTRQASYQAIVEAPAVTTAFHGGGLLTTNYQLILHDLASQPIASELGITVGSEGIVDIIASAWLNIDFVQEHGVEIWRAQPQKQKVAVLGGGMGSLSTVFGLTSQPNWQEQYDITVYQMGWRLGGKGASGRNNADDARIEEHGLHIWFGCYDAAFDLIQQCYAELKRPDGAPLQKWDDAFKPHGHIVYGDYYKGKWEQWVIDFPPNSAIPGQTYADSTLFGYASRMIKWIKNEFFKLAPQTILPPEILAEVTAFTTKFSTIFAEGLGAMLGKGLSDMLNDIMKTYGLTNSTDQQAGFLISGAELLINNLNPTNAKTQGKDSHDIEFWIEGFQKLLEIIYKNTELIEGSSVRQGLTLLRLAVAIARGVFHDNLIINGYDSIDNYDFYEWLQVSGGASFDLAHCVLIRAFYDSFFAYSKGEVGSAELTTTGNLAAGTGLHCLLRTLFDYKGAFMYKMQAGMGDVVFAPIYQVLKRRGVKFKFFHRITKVVPDNDQTIKQIIFNKQVTLKRHLDDDQYQPLIEVKDLPCWPSEPLYDQLKQAKELQEQQINLESAWNSWHDVETNLVLEKGKDFDLVVLGIPVGVHKEICADIISQNKAWQNMVAKVETAQTAALQLWMKPDLHALGWQTPIPLVTGYGQPLSTWADMSQTEPYENWSSDNSPRSVAYFCGPLTEMEVIPPYNNHAFPNTERERVQKIAKDWLQSHIGGLWPEALNAEGDFNWDLVAAQYYRANIDPSERYVLSVKGSTQYRLKPDGSGYSNLFLAGDWTYNGLNVGAIEPTVRSGLQASRAICGYPATIPGESSQATLFIL